ncbi:MAG: hypothetical protein ACTSRA_13590, partial [Promethearchaeota archaeon]
MAATRYKKWIYITLLVSFLVYLYNIIRFPIFNNSFDPWSHYASAFEDLSRNELNLNAYNGFPGLHILTVYLSNVLGLDLYMVIRWLPLFTGVLSSAVVILFLRYILKLDFPLSLLEHSRRLTIHQVEGIIIVGSILNSTICLFSVVSSGMFWGQMLTVPFIFLTLIKFLEINVDASSKNILEYFILITTLIVTHHLTCLITITFLAFTQCYLVIDKKSTLKGFLTTFISVLLFLIRYEILDLNLGIVSALTWQNTKFFYIFFLILLSLFPLLYLFKWWVVPRLSLSKKLIKLPRNNQIMDRARLVLLSLGGIFLGYFFLDRVLPFLLSSFEGLSPSWFLYYGSNLLLLAPLSIAGVLIFGSLFKNT